jgi:6-phosphogluconolactonase
MKYLRPSRLPALLASVLVGFTFSCSPSKSGTEAAGPMPLTEASTTAPHYRVYIGTGSNAPDGGIFLFDFDESNGQLTSEGLAVAVNNPGFLAMDKTHTYFYSTGAAAGPDGKPMGAVYSYVANPATGKLEILNDQSSGGADPAHISIDPSGRDLLVANYDGGNVAVLPIRQDGSLAPISSQDQHTGSSVNPDRQTKPYPHSINPDPTGKYLYAPDLGTDRVYIYDLDAANAKITPHTPPWVTVPPGSGPRHFSFAPNGKFAYLIDEMGATVIAYAYDSSTGNLTELQNISTLPPDFKAFNKSAEVVIDPAGKFLYASNRGHESIAIFSIDANTGKLTLVGWQPTLGKTPRFFALDPSGNYMIICNQDSNNIDVLKVDKATGKLTPTGVRVNAPSPMCELFVPMSK